LLLHLNRNAAELRTTMSIELELQPLDQTQIREIVRLKNAFFEDLDILQKRRGFSFVRDHEEALHLLEEVAEIVVRIRVHLATISPGVYHPLTGSAYEYFSKVDKMPPEDDFVRGLVLASLQGCGRTEELNSWIDKVIEYRNTHENDRLCVEGSILEDELLKLWKETGVMLKGTLSKEEEKYWDPSLITTLQHLLSQVGRIKKNLELLKRKREFIKRRRTASTKPTTSPPPAEQTSKPLDKVEIPIQSEKVDLKAEHAPEPQVQSEQAKVEPQSDQKVDLKAEHAPEPKEQNDQEGLIKVKTVLADVSKIGEQLQDLTKLTSEFKSRTKSLIKPKEALESIKTLQKQCSTYANQLMSDLLKLDELTGIHDLRPLKKKEADHIQLLLQDVDRLKSELGQFEIEVKPLVEAEFDKMAEEELDHFASEIVRAMQKTTEKKPKGPEISLKREKNSEKVSEISEKQAPERNFTDHTAEIPLSSAPPAKKIDLRSMWEQLRLNPRIEVDEDANYYVVFANLPGMTQESVEISISPEDGTVTIGGTRFPTDEELSEMRQLIHQRHKPKDKFEEDVYVMRYGTGRFGRFSRTYSLPPGVDVSNIKGTLNNGKLTVLIPKGRIRKIPVRTTPFAASPLPFYGDSNVWW